MGVAAGGIAGAGAVAGAAAVATTAVPAASAPPYGSTTALDRTTFRELLEASEPFKRQQSQMTRLSTAQDQMSEDISGIRSDSQNTQGSIGRVESTPAQLARAFPQHQQPTQQHDPARNCFRCNAAGHWAKDCPQQQQQQPPQQQPIPGLLPQQFQQHGRPARSRSGEIEDAVRRDRERFANPATRRAEVLAAQRPWLDQPSVQPAKPGHAPNSGFHVRLNPWSPESSSSVGGTSSGRSRTSGGPLSNIGGLFSAPCRRASRTPPPARRVLSPPPSPLYHLRPRSHPETLLSQQHRLDAKRRRRKQTEKSKPPLPEQKRTHSVRQKSAPRPGERTRLLLIWTLDTCPQLYEAPRGKSATGLSIWPSTSHSRPLVAPKATAI